MDSDGYKNFAYTQSPSAENLTLKYIDVFKETCLPKNTTENDSENSVPNDLNISLNINNDKSKVDLKNDKEVNNNTHFEDILLRPPTETIINSISRPVTELLPPLPETPKRKSSLWKRTLNKTKRRHTTPNGLIEKELHKMNISGPSNLQKIDVSDVQPLQFSRESIQACPFDITGYGDFILQDDFKIYKPKKMTLTGFLFEKVIIFTKATKNNSYYYVGSINMDNVSMEPPGRCNKELRLKDHTNSVKFQKDIKFTLTAFSENTQIRWRNAINKCLWNQLVKTKEQREETMKRIEVV